MAPIHPGGRMFSKTATPPPGGKVDSLAPRTPTALDYLGVVRFILATSVVAFHSGSPLFPDAGRQAVAGFFCISGFLITKIARETYNDRPGAFLINRALRIYPTFWACLCLYPSPFMDANIVALKPDLVEKAIMPSIPEAPLWAATGRQYRYVSPDGSAYAIVLHFERASVGAEGAGCLFGVGYAGTGWYSQGGQSPPDCPF